MWLFGVVEEIDRQDERPEAGVCAVGDYCGAVGAELSLVEWTILETGRSDTSWRYGGAYAVVLGPFLVWRTEGGDNVL